MLRLAERTIDFVPGHAHPLIRFLNGPSGRRASPAGSGLDVWEVIATVRDNEGSIEEAAAYRQIPVGLVEAAVTYYDEHCDEIAADIERVRALGGRGRRVGAPSTGSASRQLPPASARRAGESPKGERLPAPARRVTRQPRRVSRRTHLSLGYRRDSDAAFRRIGNPRQIRLVPDQ